nr:MAG TPA: hypothetical protein [Caudoviricetes sp.]
MLLCVGGSWQDYRSLNAHLLVVTNIFDYMLSVLT